MKGKRALCNVFLLALSGCGGSNDDPTWQPPASPPPVNASFQNMSASNLPTASLTGACMDVDHGDVDNDGDIDLVLAQEFSTNILLLNDGGALFTVAVGAISGGAGDNEDVRLADLGGDSSLDMLSVHEDDAVHALLINNGSGVFVDMSMNIAVTSVANAVELIDLNGDRRLDILLGNRGPNNVLIQQLNGTFVDDTANRPIGVRTTQDLLLLDIDGDTDQDLFVVNEGQNELLVNDGNGNFTDESAVRLPALFDESREADAADVDNDGDMDIVIGNVRFLQNYAIENRIYINDGTGVFADATNTALANVMNIGNSFTIRFFDIDGDGDPDILSPQSTLNQGGILHVWMNDGAGGFSNASVSPFSIEPAGSIFDIEVVDLNADGKQDIYFCYRSGTDQLYIQQ